MAVKVWALLLLLSGLTVGQQGVWRSDLTLWQAAVRSHEGPRPAFNFALALRQDGQTERAVWWLVETVDRSVGRPEEAAVRDAVRDKLLFIRMMGFQVCDSPSTQPHC